MANRRNAIKKIRADKKKESNNKSVRSELKTMARQFVALCADKQHDKAKAFAQNLFSKLDKAVKRGVVEENTANRKKSRFSKRLNLIKA